MKLVSHTGSTGGYRAALYRFPQQHTSLAMLCNASTANTTTLSLRMADVVLRGSLAPADSAAARAPRAIATGPAAVPGAERTMLTGRYVGSELLDAIWEIALGTASTELSVRRPRHDAVTVRSTSTPNTFASDDGGLVLRFEVAGKTPSSGFRLDGSRVTGLRFVRAAR